MMKLSWSEQEWSRKKRFLPAERASPDCIAVLCPFGNGTFQVVQELPGIFPYVFKVQVRIAHGTTTEITLGWRP